MSVKTASFEKYKVEYYSRKTSDTEMVRIWLYKGYIDAGNIKFVKDGATLPDNSYATSQVSGVTKVYLWFPLSRFNDVITLLREEKPLEANFDTDTKDGWIGTVGSEAVGEEEGS